MGYATVMLVLLSRDLDARSLLLAAVVIVWAARRDCTFNGVTPIREVHHEHAG